MRRPASALLPTAALTALLITLLWAAGACNNGDDDGIAPTMANIWPHADQTTWVYDLNLTTMEPDTVSPPSGELPSMEFLHADLERDLTGEVASRDTAVYTAMLDGMVTTDTGLVGQHFVESIEYAGKAPRRVVAGEAFLARLALARPDLADRLPAAARDKAALAGGPTLMGGYAFAAEDTGYYSYGDVDIIHSWIYLERSLRPGTSFDLQLVRPLADDVWLHGRIWSVADRTLGGVRYRDVVECMSVVDLGLTDVVDEDGNLLGSGRSYLYGRVYYVPGVGPVACQERTVGYFRTAYAPDASGLTRMEVFALPREMP